MIRTNLLWTAGRPVLIVLLIQLFFIILFFSIISATASIICFAALFSEFLFSFYFFRNPIRVFPVKQDNYLVCPADGNIVAITTFDTQLEKDSYKYCVSIFLSPFDVHVQWAPMGGIVEDILYKKGAFFPAFQPKSSLYNERNDIIIKNNKYGTIKVRQIAGTVARRICCWVKKYEQLSQGQKYGMIRFGSRIDIFLPETIAITVTKGQRVYGGKTPLGYWST